MNKMRQIAKEYGEPFAEVVKGFAEQGCSRTLTAKTLGMNLSYFRTLCVRLDLMKHFKPQGKMKKDCKGSGKGWPKGLPKHNRSKYTDDEILQEVKRYPVSTNFASLSDIDITTVYRRFGSFTQARRQAL